LACDLNAPLLNELLCTNIVLKTSIGTAIRCCFCERGPCRFAVDLQLPKYNSTPLVDATVSAAEYRPEKGASSFRQFSRGRFPDAGPGARVARSGFSYSHERPQGRPRQVSASRRYYPIWVLVAAGARLAGRPWMDRGPSDHLCGVPAVRIEILA